MKQNTSEVWSRPLSDGSVALLLFNRKSDAAIIEADFKLVCINWLIIEMAILDDNNGGDKSDIDDNVKCGKGQGE